MHGQLAPSIFERINLPPSVGARIPVTLGHTARGIVPAFALHYLYAVLVCLPQTRNLRVSLLPLALFLVWNAATRYDVAAGIDAHGHLNYGICVRSAPCCYKHRELKGPLRSSCLASPCATSSGPSSTVHSDVQARHRTSSLMPWTFSLTSVAWDGLGQEALISAALPPRFRDLFS